MTKIPEATFEIIESQKNRGRKRFVLVIVVSFLLLVLTLALIILQLSKAPNMPAEGISFEVEKGMSVQKISEKARDVGIVKSSLFLYSVLTYLYDPTAIYAGTYQFSEPLSVFDVAKKLSLNDVDNSLLSITIPEGVTRKQIAFIATNKLQDFDTTKFFELTKNNEGYLFPDTYYIPNEFTAEEFVDLLVDTFLKRIAPLKEQIEASDLTEYEIVILASILEREANDELSMKTVSGILQNRLSIGMALQTDASIEYVLDKSLSELVPSDLKIDTPYNTYLYPGLTPTPIGNPGIQAIEAVLNPIETDYLYYITGNDGEFYYAKSFEQHKLNIARHLR